MRDSEIKASKIILKAIEKEKEKYVKKAEKERRKANSGIITYKGDVYATEADILDAYACDIFSSSTCDRLIERLNKAKGLSSSDDMTESELIIFELDKYISNIRNDLLQDEWEKQHKAYYDKRMHELTEEQGYSYREATTILNNEELMMQYQE